MSYPQAIDVLVQDMLSWGMLRSLACYAHIVVLGRLELELIDRQVAFQGLLFSRFPLLILRALLDGMSG